MADSTQILEYLIELKKTKKDPNKIERDEFYNAWTNLAKEEGFSDKAEQFLYSGFTYCGAQPYWDYIHQEDDSESQLQKLYNGKLFGENCASTSQILIHLIALELNKKTRNLPLLVSYIKHLPDALKNKEGKIYGQAGRTLKKYLFDVLRNGISYPGHDELDNAGLNALEMQNFRHALSDILSNIDFSGYSQKCKANILAVNSWLEREFDERMSDNTEDSVSEKDRMLPIAAQGELPMVVPESVTPRNSSAQPEDLECGDNAVSGSDFGAEQNQEVAELLHLAEQKEEIERELNDAIEKIAQLKFMTSEQKNELDILRKEYQMCWEERGELERTNAHYQVQINECRETIATLENDIQERTAMIEMLRRDRNRQSNESLNRIAARLRSYYVDYSDARDLEMSLELGENLRDQMGEIFRILEAAGLSVK